MGKIQDLAGLWTLVAAYDEKSEARAEDERKMVALMLDLRECKRNVQVLRAVLEEEVVAWRPYMVALRGWRFKSKKMSKRKNEFSVERSMFSLLSVLAVKCD